MLFFVTALGWGYSILAGAFTMSIMILPLIMRTTEEALKAVPDTYREGKLWTWSRKAAYDLPDRASGSGSWNHGGSNPGKSEESWERRRLDVHGRNGAAVATSPMSSGRTLAVHMYNLSSEGLYMDQAYATAVILLVVVVAMNALSAFVARKLTKGTR